MGNNVADIAAKISVSQEFSHVESPLILRICEAYELETLKFKQSDFLRAFIGIGLVMAGGIIIGMAL